MQETLQVLFSSTITVNNKSSFLGKPPPNYRSENDDYADKRTLLSFPASSPPNSLSLPSPKTHQIQEILCRSVFPPSPSDSKQRKDSEFQDKVLFLDSIGLDIFSLLNDHRPVILASSLPKIKSTIDYLTSSLALTSIDLRRLISMSPEILCLSPSTIACVFTFLKEEAGVKSTSDLKRVIHRRPRLLVSSVADRLRPTLCFLHSIGISETHKHTYLLSCSVEDKFLPKISYFQGIGLAYRDVISMFRRFPQLFNYSVKDNIEPKVNYFVMEMGRDLKEMRDYPHYFSFSLEKRIKRRHRQCADCGVYFPLPALLWSSDVEFRARLDALCESSLPLKTSPFNCCSNFETCDGDHSSPDSVGL